MDEPLDGFWRIESTRLTVFPAEPVTLEDVHWWEDVVESKPANSVIDRRVPTLTETGEFPSESGFGRNANLQLVLQPLRAQWNMLPPDDLPPGEIGMVGSWSAAMPAFGNLMGKWLRMAPILNRLALGVVLIGPAVADRADAYKLLRPFLPFEIDPETSDFLLQTNKRTQSSVIDIPINRLTKWSAVRINLLTFVAGDALDARRDTLITAPRLEMDINTAPEQHALPSDRLTELWDELIRIGQGLANKGIVAW